MGHDMGQWDMGVNINIGQWVNSKCLFIKYISQKICSMLKYEFEGVVQIITQ